MSADPRKGADGDRLVCGRATAFLEHSAAQRACLTSVGCALGRGAKALDACHPSTGGDGVTRGKRGACGGDKAFDRMRVVVTAREVSRQAGCVEHTSIVV
jgi:hypothetical protein